MPIIGTMPAANERLVVAIYTGQTLAETELLIACSDLAVVQAAVAEIQRRYPTWNERAAGVPSVLQSKQKGQA